MNNERLNPARNTNRAERPARTGEEVSSDSHIGVGLFGKVLEFFKDGSTRRQAMIKSETASKPGTKLEIVWRNSDRRSKRRRRRHTFERQGDQAHYVLQEYVADGCLGYWMTLSNLEVVAGGRVA